MGVGFVLVAAGIVLLALRIFTTWIDLHWLGVALIVLGAGAIVVDLVLTADRNRRIPPQ